MTRLSKPLSAHFLFLLLVSTVLSQQPGPNTEGEMRRQRQRLQANSMIEQAAAEASLWDDKKAAVEVLADAADLLWDETPAQATKWLAKAWILIGQVAEAPRNEKLKEFFSRSLHSELRTLIISIARKHDSQLAEKFLQQVADDTLGEKKERGVFDDRTARSEQLLRLAQQVIDTNPDLAFSLAQRSLADGISQSLQNILTSLRKKNVGIANRLFDLALARLGNGSPDPSEAEVLAGYLFQPGLTFSANSSGQTILVLNPDQRSLPIVARVEPQRAREFLATVYRALLTRPISIDTDEGRQRGQRLLVLGNHILGRYNIFAPEFAQPAQGFMAQLQRQLAPADKTAPVAEGTMSDINTEATSTKTLTKEELYEKNLSELEDQADKENNSSFKMLAYVQAALTAKPEDYQRGQRLAGKISNDELRADTVSFVLYRAAMFFVERDEIEKAVGIVPQIGDPLRRAVAKIAIAQRLATSNAEKGNLGELSLKQQLAFDLLVDMESDLIKERPSALAAKVALGRTSVLARLDNAQALLSLEQAVQIINKLSGFDLRERSAPDLGLEASGTSGATVARPKFGFDLRSAVEPMIKTNFEQISVVVERFTSKEVNGLARLEVAKLYLQHSPDSNASLRELSDRHR
jgi:hypothetical protein